MIAVLLVAVSSAAVVGAEQTKGEFTVLGGSPGFVGLNYDFSQKWSFSGQYEEGILHSGIIYQPSDRFGLQLGLRYDIDAKESIGYGRLDYSIPFGSNLRFHGYVDTNYEGKDWTTYETAIRIELYPDQYLHVGFRGDTGDGFQGWDYNIDDDGNLDKDPMIFLKGDFHWLLKKRLDINLRPLLYVKGTYLHDYDIKYLFNERMALMLNINSLYDNDYHYRLGFQIKF